jgi:hypothetical protein
MLTVATRDTARGQDARTRRENRAEPAKLLGDMVLSYEGEVDGGYEAGTSLANWTANQTGRESDA